MFQKIDGSKVIPPAPFFPYQLEGSDLKPLVLKT